MKAAVKKKKLKNKKKKEKSLPNLFSGQGKKISDPRGKTPGSKISGSWGDETFRVRGSVPLAWELTLCDQFSLSANTAPRPAPTPPGPERPGETSPLRPRNALATFITWRLQHSLARAQLQQRRRDTRSIVALCLRF
jgi:hypothetical protein